MNTRLSSRAMRAAILYSASTLALATLAAPALAQQAPAAKADSDVVVVTGVRGSLQRSMNVKKNATGVVDAISAEDIGKYPDTNLAESVQRIPGVSIDRVNGEGAKVTVRGFGPGFNLVTLNGRVMPTASIDLIGSGNTMAMGGSRNFDFSNIAADSVSGFEVYKTGKANVASGGIGATLNIKTLRPIGKAGSTGTLSIKALHADNLVDGKDWTPEVTGAYSWTNPSKSFGVALFGQYTERDNATRQATENAWNLDTYAQFYDPNSGRLRYAADKTTLLTQITNAPPAGSLIAYPNDSRYALSQTHNKRTNLGATVQFRPSESLLFTVDALYVDNEGTEQRAEQTNWFNRPFDHITFQKGASGIYNALYVQENENGTKDIGFEQQLQGQKNTLSSIGANAKWTLNDRATLSFDVHSSEGKATPNNPNGTSSVMISLGAPVVAQHSVDFTGDIPVQSYTVLDSLPVYKTNSSGQLVDSGGAVIVDGNGNYLPGKSAANRVVAGYRGNNNGVLDVGDLGTQVARMATNSQTHKIDEAKVDFSYDLNGESRFDAGVDLIKSKMETTTGSTYQALGDWGIAHPGDVAQYAPGLVTTYDLGGLFKDFTPGQANIAFRGNALDIYEAMAKSPLYNATIPTAAMTSNTVQEDIKAVYGQFTMKGDFLGRPATVVAGLRYEKTDVDASAMQSQPVAIRWTADNDFTVDSSSNIVSQDYKSHYDNWLPSLDISWAIQDDLIARASFSKTIARAAYSQLYATTNPGTPPRPTANGTNPTATSGNPGLLPLESSNVDLSLEWYYGKDSYVSIGFYNKDVNNFVGTGRVEANPFGLRDPSSGAPGSRSGVAKTLLGSINQSTTDVNLFTMTALYDHYLKTNDPATPGVNYTSANAQAKAKSDYQANLDGSGNLNQTYVDSVLQAYDLVADANDPLFVFDTNIPVNNKTANLHGIEFAFQHFFGDSGFGASGSLTTVSGDIGFDNSAPPGTQQFPLLGLSNTYNITAIYDKGAWSGRISYNWRDKFISATNIGAQGDPGYTAAFGTVDAALNYQVTPVIQITFEGLNLNKARLRQYGRDTTNLYFAQELDSRYQIGLRYKF
ncbi:TonB-dependent receptor [Asticcacaulis solisilvae]|uniref:TonB-dependent receptor n=1 Tax=Asticcacaulis solisilvae TaxID=1217274 RepID=UPI003FD7DDA1